MNNRSLSQSAHRVMLGIRKNKAIYMIMLPAIIWYIIFAYFPMGGLSLAFKDYKVNKGILGSPWVGFENFEYVFRDNAFWNSIWRTLQINFGRIIFEFPAPVILALALNELRATKYKKVVQTIFTLPNFLSWVIISSIMTSVLSRTGIVNNFFVLLGGVPVNFLANEKTFQPLLYASNIWKSAGYSAIVYMAAISGIDQDQYEAAEIDGAGRWKRLVHITFPNILPTVIILLVLTVGQIMSAGFDQIFNLRSPAVNDISETLDIYIYRITFQGATNFSFSSVVSLFRSVVNMLLLLVASTVSRKITGTGILA